MYRNSTHAQNFSDETPLIEAKPLLFKPKKQNFCLSIFFEIAHYFNAQFIPFNQHETLILLFSRQLLVKV